MGAENFKKDTLNTHCIANISLVEILPSLFYSSKKSLSNGQERVFLISTNVLVETKRFDHVHLHGNFQSILISLLQERKKAEFRTHV